MKRFFTFFFALLSACTFSAYAAVVDGTCGDNLTWTLNSKDSTLVISGTGAMADNPSWSDYKSYIKYVTIQDGVTTIGNGVFERYESLTSVTIGNSVTSIGNYAFYDCSGLTSITIPNSVTSIGGWAFQLCESLTSVTLGNSVTSIGRSSFDGCIGLTSINFPNSLTSIGEQAFGRCGSLTSITIPNSVISIERSAFEHCSGLTSINIPNSVTSIGELAFQGCSGLTSVTLGKNLTSIGESAFAWCNKIRVVTSYASTPPVAASCGLNQTAATLYVLEEYIGTYSNSVWWEDFKEIRAIDPNLVGGNKDLTLVFKDQDNAQISTQSITVMFPPAPVIEGFTFLYWLPVAEPVEDKITLQAVYESNTSAVLEVFVNPANPAQKLIRNGQVYILHEDKQYTISGQVVK